MVQTCNTYPPLQILTVVTQILGLLATFHGLGNHMTVIVEKNEAQNFLKFTWTCVFFFNLAIATGKAAVVSFLVEISASARE